jgi:hypothetical protein
MEFWQETSRQSPVSELRGVSCPDITIITNGQCQAACYYSNKPYALLYTENSFLKQGECWCASSCDEQIDTGVFIQYTMYKWFEGFFFNPDTNEVWILAYTNTDDLVINLWVEVEDDCGNSAVAKVEFWISPSLEEAAAKGRTCEQPDTDLGLYLHPFAFTSDNIIAPTFWELKKPENQGDVRLHEPKTNEDGTIEGLLLTFYDDNWGTVCDDVTDCDDPDGGGTDDCANDYVNVAGGRNLAKVVCRELGYTGGAEYNADGGSSGYPIVVDGTSNHITGCSGEESSFKECQWISFGSHNCGHYEDVGVRCTTSA